MAKLFNPSYKHISDLVKSCEGMSPSDLVYTCFIAGATAQMPKPTEHSDDDIRATQAQDVYEYMLLHRGERLTIKEVFEACEIPLRSDRTAAKKHLVEKMGVEFTKTSSQPATFHLAALNGSAHPVAEPAE